MSKRMKSSAPRANIFETVKAANIPQSRYNLSYMNKLDAQMGKLYPIYVENVVPGDKFDIASGVFGRSMPMITPIMQDVDIEIRYFYVPWRLVWENFEDYVTGVGDHIPPVLGIDSSYTDNDGDQEYLADLLDADYINDNNSFEPLVDELPFRAYNFIWNEYFRDENIDTELDVFADEEGHQRSLSDGDFAIRRVRWRKDYFTSALPWTQRGDEAQFVGDVFLKNQQAYQDVKWWSNGGWAQTSGLGYGESSDQFIGLAPGNGGGIAKIQGAINNPENNIVGISGTNSNRYNIDPNGTLGVSFGINQLRYANWIQRFLERSAIGGNRYSEFIMAHFGIHCADSRLQRPEYLGGGKVSLMTSEVLQNEQAQLDSNGNPYANSTPQGNLAGKGVVSGGFRINKPTLFPEYGVVMGLLYVRPKASYFQGIHRRMLFGVTDQGTPLIGSDRFDRVYYPELGNLGEQPVHQFELYADDTALGSYAAFLRGQTSNNGIFGYQSQYAWMKYRADEIHGKFKTSLKFWHLGREFQSVPTLSAKFLECNPSDRIYAVTDDDEQFIFEIYNKVDAVRPMNAYGTPVL